MKILLTIHHDLDPHSGAPGTVLKLGQCYESLGHEVHYFAFDHIPRWLKRAKALIFPECLAVYLLKHANDFDVIDASTGDAWIWGSFVHHRGKEARPILVTHSHGLEHAVHFEKLEQAKQGALSLSWKYPFYWGGFRLWEVEKSLCCADLVFLLNHQDLDYVVDHLGGNPDRISIVSNGIPETFLNQPIEPIFSNSQSNRSVIRIAQIGSYLPRKGIQYSIPALNKILSEYSNVKVSLLGTGCPQEQVLADFSTDLHTRVNVIPQFHHSELPSLLRNHHIKLFTPLSEGFGNVLIESMACGLAPITTSAPGPLEIVQDGYDAIVIPLRDRQAIEEALRKLIDQPLYLECLRQKAYKTAQQYNWLEVAKHRLSLYELTMNEKISPKQFY
jgi:glycosyltransferase involved in cell wall biosynthesis